MGVLAIKCLSAFFVMNGAWFEIHLQEFRNKECRSAMLSDVYWLQFGCLPLAGKWSAVITRTIWLCQGILWHPVIEKDRKGVVVVLLLLFLYFVEAEQKTWLTMFWIQYVQLCCIALVSRDCHLLHRLCMVNYCHFVLIYVLYLYFFRWVVYVKEFK